MKKWTMGSDPEFFILDPQTNQFKSAIGIVHGSKTEKLDLGNGHYAFYDNVLGECNIKPGNNLKEVIDNFRDCMQRYAKAISPYKLTILASHTFPQSELQHEEAKRFGCDPSFDAYLVAVNSPPNCEPGNGFRTGGGHVHLGGEFFPLNDEWGKIWVIRMLDLFAGIPAIFIDHDPTSTARRKLYGNAGDHRPQPYGVEYRSISNFWLQSPKYVEWMYNTCDFVLDICVNNKHEAIFESYKAKNIQKCINTGDKKLADRFMAMCQKLMPKSLWQSVEDLRQPQTHDLYKEWNIA